MESGGNGFVITSQATRIISPITYTRFCVTRKTTVRACGRSRARLMVMEFALCNVTQSIPFYRINYLALHSILSFSPEAGPVNTLHSRASFRLGFVFALGMTHRRIIFVSFPFINIGSTLFLATVHDLLYIDTNLRGGQHSCFCYPYERDTFATVVGEYCTTEPKKA